MKLNLNLKKKILNNLQKGTSSGGLDNEPQFYIESLGSQDDPGLIQSFRPSPPRTRRQWGCFPLRRRRSHFAPVLVEPPTYEQAIQLDENNPTRVVRDSVIRKFPKGKPRGKVAEEGCRICLSPFEKPVEIPCNHMFCRECISKWLTSQRTCPICRYEFCEGHTKLVIPK